MNIRSCYVLAQPFPFAHAVSYFDAVTYSILRPHRSNAHHVHKHRYKYIVETFSVIDAYIYF